MSIQNGQWPQDKYAQVKKIGMKITNYNLKENKMNAKEQHIHCAMKAHTKRSNSSDQANNGNFPEEVVFVSENMGRNTATRRKQHKERQ